MENVSALKGFRRDLTFAICKAHKSIVWIDSFDYGYVKDLLDDILSSKGSKSVWFWSNSTGEIRDSSGRFIQTVTVKRQDERTRIINNLKEAVVTYTEALKWFVNTKECSHLVLRVSENNFSEKEAIPTLQEFVYLNYNKPLSEKRTIILITASHFEISGLEHICERFKLPLPNINDIDEELGFINADISRNKKGEVIGVGPKLEGEQIVKKDRNGIYSITDPSKGLVKRDEQGNVLDIMISDNTRLNYPFSDDFVVKDEAGLDIRQHYQVLVDSLCGMYLFDIKELLKSIIAKYGWIVFRDGKKTIDKIIMEEKKQIVRNSGLLEMIDYDEDYWTQVADIEELMNYIDSERNRINNPNNYPPKLPKPKGILLVGAPGCGKSVSAKAIASMLKKPLYRLDIGKLLGHKYGQSENRFIEALHTADASAPCVLWIDEIEKAFAGAGNESENDDTLTHIVGYFLTWMQEHPTMVYLVATANDLSRMKPEMLRKGRWDERFYLTYPSSEGCKKIIRAISEKKMKLKVKVKYFKDKKEIVDDVFIPSIKVDDPNSYSVNDKAQGALSTITKVLHLNNKSGAEIENIIVGTIVKNNHQKYEDNWVVFLDDMAQTIFDDLIDNRDEIAKSIIDDFKGNHNKSGEKPDPIKNLENYIENRKENRKDEEEGNYDPFIWMKVNKDIQDVKIREMKKELRNEKELKELLFKKYKEQYKFKPASGSNKK